MVLTVPAIGVDFFHTLDFFGSIPCKQDSDNSVDPSGVYDLKAYIRKGKLAGGLPFSLETATSGMCFKRQYLEKLLPMAEAIRITSDDYLKYVALGMSAGYISLNNLALQRIHDNNAYTLRPDRKNLKVKIQLLTGYYIKKNFPELTAFANNLISLGIALHWWGNQDNLENQDLIQNSLSQLSPLEQSRIYIKALYYRHIYYRLKR